MSLQSIAKYLAGRAIPVVIADPEEADCPVVFTNDAFGALTGYSNDECVGRNCRFLQGPDTNPAAIAAISRALAAQRSVEISLVNYKKNGETFRNLLIIHPLTLGDGRELFLGFQYEAASPTELLAEASRRRVVSDTMDATRAQILALREGRVSTLRKISSVLLQSALAQGRADTQGP